MVRQIKKSYWVAKFGERRSTCVYTDNRLEMNCRNWKRS